VHCNQENLYLEEKLHFASAVQGLGSIIDVSSKLSSAIQQLSKINIPDSVNIEMNKPIQVNVNINGAEVLAAISPELNKLVSSQIYQSITSVINIDTGEVNPPGPVPDFNPPGPVPIVPKNPGPFNI
jgi:hypothetical protein